MQPVREMLGLIRNVPCTNAQTEKSAYSKEEMYPLVATCAMHRSRRSEEEEEEEQEEESTGAVLMMSLETQRDREV